MTTKRALQKVLEEILHRRGRKILTKKDSSEKTKYN
jgi:hypothetical protein